MTKKGASREKRVNLVASKLDTDPRSRYLARLIEDGLILEEGSLKLKGKPLMEYLIFKSAKQVDPNFLKESDQQKKREEALGSPEITASGPSEPAKREIKRMAPPPKEKLQEHRP